MKTELIKSFFWRTKVVNIYEFLIITSFTSLRNYSYVVDDSDLSGVGYICLTEASTAAKQDIDSQRVLN